MPEIFGFDAFSPKEIAGRVKTFGAIRENADAVSWIGLFSNLVPAILGNLIGGSVLVGLVYNVICRRAPIGNKEA